MSFTFANYNRYFWWYLWFYLGVTEDPGSHGNTKEAGQKPAMEERGQERIPGQKIAVLLTPPDFSPTNFEQVPQKIENERAGAESKEPDRDLHVKWKVRKKCPAHGIEYDRVDDPEPQIENEPPVILQNIQFDAGEDKSVLRQETDG
jgi:hypothetical protein